MKAECDALDAVMEWLAELEDHQRINVVIGALPGPPIPVDALALVIPKWNEGLARFAARRRARNIVRDRRGGASWSKLAARYGLAIREVRRIHDEQVRAGSRS